MYKKLWPYGRLALYIVIGIMNTVLIRNEDIGSWKNYAGYLFLIAALIDGIFIVRKLLKSKRKN